MLFTHHGQVNLKNLFKRISLSTGVTMQVRLNINLINKRMLGGKKQNLHLNKKLLMSGVTLNLLAINLRKFKNHTNKVP